VEHIEESTASPAGPPNANQMILKQLIEGPRKAGRED
jgi:hypothetical protein